MHADHADDDDDADVVCPVYDHTARLGMLCGRAGEDSSSNSVLSSFCLSLLPGDSTGMPWPCTTGQSRNGSLENSFSRSAHFSRREGLLSGISHSLSTSLSIAAYSYLSTMCCFPLSLARRLVRIPAPHLCVSVYTCIHVSP